MHKSIHASVTLTITDPNKVTLVSGFATFYLTRGDVAAIPDELKDRGFGPDSTRWYIERWEDDTANPQTGGRALAAPVAPARATPALDEFHRTWGGVKVTYR